MSVEIERTSYIGFVSGKFEENIFYNFFTTFTAEEKMEETFFGMKIFLQNFHFLKFFSIY
jgi:hypothetical protein